MPFLDTLPIFLIKCLPFAYPGARLVPSYPGPHAVQLG